MGPDVKTGKGGEPPRPIPPEAVPALLRLNNVHQEELSWLELDRFRHLLAEAFYARRLSEADAFLLAFEQGAAYDSPNYLWFRARYPRFVYVDRLVTAPAARRRGLAGRLYADLFDQARAAGHALVGCEVTLDPPNPGSDTLHEALGFAESGRAVLPGGKLVRYLVRPL